MYIHVAIESLSKSNIQETKSNIQETCLERDYLQSLKISCSPTLSAHEATLIIDCHAVTFNCHHDDVI